MIHRVRAAGILVENDRMLLVRDGTLATGEPYFIPPGGGLELSDATLVHCLCREVFEETGLRMAAGEPIYIKEFLEPERDTHHVEIFFLASRSAAEPGDAEATPDRPFDWYTREQMAHLVVFPEVLKDAFWRERAGGSLRCRYLGKT